MLQWIVPVVNTGLCSVKSRPTMSDTRYGFKVKRDGCYE